MKLRDAADSCVIDLVRRSHPGLPEDYLHFLARHNGGEGFLGPDRYAVLWAAEDLTSFNRDYDAPACVPGVFLIGSNGGGEAYGFDLQDFMKPVVRIPFIGMSHRYKQRLGSFQEFMGDFLNH